MKSGIVAIVGRPSAGKSTLMNALCGQKIAITSPIPQTTRNKIRGILNTEEGQLVFIDTPGYHNSEKKMNLILTDLVHSSLGDAEAVLYVTDSTREPGKEEEEIVDILRNIRAPLIIALNKTDLNSPQSQHVYDFLNGNFPEQPVIKVSAVTKSGFGPLIAALYAAVPEDHPLYPDDYYTDQTPEFRITEIVREKAFQRLRQEIPHSLYVEVADLEMKTLPSGKEKLWARTFLVVEKESQKGMVIGKHAANIKEIRISAERELNRIFPYRVHLDLRVKVNKKWRKKDQLIQGMFR